MHSGHRVAVASFLSLLALVSISPLIAQPYTGDIYSVTGEGTLCRTDRVGQVTTLADAPTLSDGISLSWDGHAVLWSEWGNRLSRTPSRIHEWRGSRDTILFSTMDFQIEEVIVNQDGDVVFSGTDWSITPNVTGMFKWTGGQTVSTVATHPDFQARRFLDGGIDVDIRTGHYLVGSGPATTLVAQAWAVAESGAVTSLISRYEIGLAFDAQFAMHQNKRTGQIAQSGDTRYYVIQPDGLRFKPFLRFARFVACRLDRVSTPAKSHELYAIHHGADPVSARLTIVQRPLSTLLDQQQTSTVISPTPTLWGCRGMVFADERNIGTLKTGPGAWALNLNFPGEPGKRYVVGIGVSGHAPGLTLPDGRHICVNVDALTYASVLDLLRPALDPGPGRLDATGNATGSIDLGVDNVGVLLHMVALTMTGTTIDTISSPIVLRL